MDVLLPLVQEVGFPIAVTFFLLYRIEAKLELMIQAIQSLPDKLKP